MNYPNFPSESPKLLSKATLACKHVQFTDVVARELLTGISRWSAQNIGNTAWSFAKLKVYLYSSCNIFVVRFSMIAELEKAWSLYLPGFRV